MRQVQPVSSVPATRQVRPDDSVPATRQVQPVPSVPATVQEQPEDSVPVYHSEQWTVRMPMMRDILCRLAVKFTPDVDLFANSSNHRCSKWLGDGGIAPNALRHASGVIVSATVNSICADTVHELSRHRPHFRCFTCGKHLVGECGRWALS